MPTSSIRPGRHRLVRIVFGQVSGTITPLPCKSAVPLPTLTLMVAMRLRKFPLLRYSMIRSPSLAAILMSNTSGYPKGRSAGTTTCASTTNVHRRNNVYGELVTATRSCNILGAQDLGRHPAAWEHFSLMAGAWLRLCRYTWRAAIERGQPHTAEHNRQRGVRATTHANTHDGSSVAECAMHGPLSTSCGARAPQAYALKGTLSHLLAAGHI